MVLDDNKINWQYRDVLNSISTSLIMLIMCVESTLWTLFMSEYIMESTRFFFLFEMSELYPNFDTNFDTNLITFDNKLFF